MNTRFLGATAFVLAIVAGSATAQNQPGHIQAQRLISEGLSGFSGELEANSEFGNAIADLGDVDGDGISDIAIGAPSSGVGGIGSGRVWLLFMNVDGSVRTSLAIDNDSLPIALLASDAFGDAVEPAGDLDGNGVPDMWVGASGHDGAGAPGTANNEGAIYAVLLQPSGGVLDVKMISGASPGLDLDPNSAFGRSIAVIGDVYQDGTADLAVGAPRDSGGGLLRGAVWILNLKAGGQLVGASRHGPGSPTLNPDVTGAALFGSSVEGLGDVDGNGSPDFAVGAYRDGPSLSYDGSVWIYFNDANGPVTIRSLDASSPGFGFEAPQADEQFGRSLAAMGDIDGDGHGDLAVGASLGGSSDRGAIWMLRLTDDPDNLLKAGALVDDDHGFLGFALDPSDRMGTGLAPAGDRDGDGITDVLVGIQGYDGIDASEGAVALLNVRGPTITNLGENLAGTFKPKLVADGVLQPGKLFEVQLANAQPFGGANLFLGFKQLDAPFRGGTMVPALDVINLNMPVDASGTLLVDGMWPAGIPAGFPTYIQFWMLDAGAPVGVNASNALLLLAAE